MDTDRYKTSSLVHRLFIEFRDGDCPGCRFFTFSGCSNHIKNNILALQLNKPADGCKMCHYSELTAVLIEAIKELKAEVDRLKAEIQTIKNALR